MYYSKLKILHYKLKLDTLGRYQPILPPIHIRIKPTNVCNHNCYYCSYQNSYGQLGKDMNKQDKIPFEKLVKIINDCEVMGVRAITFSGGGEPLLYPGIADIFKEFRTIKLAVLTNGIMLKDETAEVLAKKATWIRISIDGWSHDSYRAYRNCDIGDYEKLVRNVVHFQKLKSKCILGINIIIDTYNAMHVYEMVKFWHDLGIESIKLSPAIVSNNSAVNYSRHTGVAEKLAKELEKINNDKIPIYNGYHAQLEGFVKDYTWCPYAQILPIIGADQNVYCCHDKAYNLDTGLLGSLRNTTFKKFWFNGKSKFFKINPKEHCNHHCVTDKTNKMILEYLAVSHKEFV